MRSFGGWRQGDPVGRRLFQRLDGDGSLALEGGGVLGNVVLAYEAWGKLNPERSNAILLLHGFSGDSHAAGPADRGHAHVGWWDGLIGPGRAIDTDRFFVVCPNVLGGCQGSLGPSSLASDGKPYGSRFPALSIRDLVAAEQRWAKALGIDHWYAVIGGSLGGMRALEWAISAPECMDRLIVLATTAQSSPENRAFHSTQLRAIRLDPAYHDGNYYGCSSGGPVHGLALARSIARLTYGCEKELSLRFEQGEEAAVAQFLEDDGQALCRRFDANSYIVLTNAMSGHDIGRGRGGVKAALSRVKARTRIVSIDTDRLFPPHQQLELSRHLKCGVTYTTIDSPFGHDGFLSEQRQLDSVLRQSLG